MISILCPSRSRPDSLLRLYGTAASNAKGEWELVVRIDEDDPERGVYQSFLLSRMRLLVGERGVLSEMWNECWRAARGDVFMHAGDDITINTLGWDELVMRAFPEDGIAFVHGHDLSPNGDWLGTHGFLHRSWTDTVGYFVPPYFSSDYNDAWLNEVAEKIGRRVYIPELITEHHHPAFSKGEWDQTHVDRVARHWADDVDGKWKATADERENWAAMLRERMP